MRPQASSSGDGVTPHEAFQRTKVFTSLDGLRALSILGVLWHHAGEGQSRWPAANRGFLGVDLFFVISGFLIVTLLLRERERTGLISMRGFYVRRFLRIFPPYYLLLLVVAGVAYLVAGRSAGPLRHDLPYAALYIGNLVPMTSLLSITWSLATEEQFYLVVPALVAFTGRALPALLVLAYVAATAPAFGAFPSVNLPAFFRQTTFGPILLGVLLAVVLHSRRGHALAHRLLGSAAAPLVTLGLVVLASSHPAKDISGWPRVLIHASLVALVASCVVREEHALRPLLGWWPMRRIGAVSYGIYLYHMLVLHFAAMALGRVGLSSRVAAFAAVALGTWAVAELSYRSFESRFLRLKSRFGGPSAPASAVEKAVSLETSAA